MYPEKDEIDYFRFKFAYGSAIFRDVRDNLPITNPAPGKAVSYARIGKVDIRCTKTGQETESVQFFIGITVLRKIANTCCLLLNKLFRFTNSLN